MTTRSLRAALLLALASPLALGAPAWAQPAAPREPATAGFVPLTEGAASDARWARARPGLAGALSGLQRAAAAAWPPARRLAPPTTGRLRLAVVLVGFPDAPGGRWAPAAWEEALLSRGTYARTPTGQRAFGSMADWYAENSGGALAVEGRVFDWVAVPQTRAGLEAGLLVDPRARGLFAAALDALLAREGPRALDAFDALAFVVAGPQARRRGSVLWPHATAIVHRGRPWRYYLMHAEEQGGAFAPIGVHCHELGHVLGLLDKYGVGRGTGLGQWCAMATGAHGARARGLAVDAPARGTCETARDLAREQLATVRDWLRELGLGRAALPWQGSRRSPVGGAAPPSSGEARPLHLCAVCKVRLGWTTPVTLDPTRTTRVYMRAVEGDPGQVARVPLDRRGRQALVLEQRRRVGFDAELPREGLLVWRTGDPAAQLRTFVPFDTTELLPAHGVRSTDAALRDPRAIPFPPLDAQGRPRADAVLDVAGTGPGALRVRLSGVRLDDAGRAYVEVGPAPRGAVAPALSNR